MLRVRQKLGKYRIDRRLAEGGYALVYKAYDTVTGTPVALKVPYPAVINRKTLEAFRREGRVAAKLDHPNILPVRDAGLIDGTFVIVYPLGKESLGDRLQRRLARRTMVELAGQMLEAVAFAHRHRVMHCDLKPENFILFPENRLRLGDFGIARLALRTLSGSGTGTVGYLAPEQALGRPSFRSDVFSLGLILYRMFSGQLPQWPFTWPPPGFDRLRKNCHTDLMAILRRALEVDHHKRFADGAQMLAAFRRIRPHALRTARSPRRRKVKADQRNWQTVRRLDFLRQYRKVLEISGECSRCRGPIAETMQFCPWCRAEVRASRLKTRFPRRCPRCKRGVKTDWRFCPWCYGAAINADADRRYGDARYTRRCTNQRCDGGLLMPFMRYCPTCRQKVRRAWKIENSKSRCPRCRWGVVPEYWDYCPWCGRTLGKR